MDTPPAATVHKKNVHVGGGKTFNMRKPIKLKPAGKRRKARADFRDTYAPSSGVSNAAHGKQQIAGADLFTTKKQIVNRASKVANLNTEMGSKPLNHVLSDEESEWDSDECVCSTWYISEDEDSSRNLMSLEWRRGALPFLNFSSRRTQNYNKGNVIEDSGMSSPVPRFYTPEEEPDDFFGATWSELKMYPKPELKLEDYPDLDNENRMDGEKTSLCTG